MLDFLITPKRALVRYNAYHRASNTTMLSSQLLQRKRDLEVQTGKVLAIEASPTTENIAKCHQQSQSPLFSVLPAEIRNEIFSLALLQHEDLAHPYPENGFCYRPGHRARRVVNTALLLTCRRIWLEANHWPMEQAVHSFWFGDDRRPGWANNKSHHCNDDLRFQTFFSSLTTLQHSRIKHIQVLVQMHWLVGSLRSSYLWNRLRYHLPSVRTFTITIRHSDWPLWEHDMTLRLDVDKIHNLLHSPGATHITEFRLELETLEWRIHELRPILESLKKVGELPGREDVPLELIEPFEKTFWSGPTDLGEKKRDIYSKRDKLDYCVTTLKWRRRNVAAEKAEQRWHVEGSLLQLLETASAESDDSGRADVDSTEWQSDLDSDEPDDDEPSDDESSDDDDSDDDDAE